MGKLTHARLISVLDYDPETGIFKWKVKIGKGLVGQVAGSKDRAGYRRIMVDGERFLAHRLAWFYAHGRWPDGQIDHREVDNDDNRIMLLREATASENQSNRRIQKNNTTGFKGVDFIRKNGMYRARIKKDGRLKYLGTFSSAEAAHAAYVSAANDLHGKFARVA